MIQDTEQMNPQNLSYETVAEYFTSEAKTLLPDSAIAEVLEEERITFQNAAALQLKPSKITGGNLMRYCKDLLRRRQPLSFVYFLLCFATEVSILMLLYGILAGLCLELFSEESGFFSSFSFAYGLIICISFTLCKMLLREQRKNLLVLPLSSEEETKKRRKLLGQREFFLRAGTLILTLAALLLARELHLAQYTIQITGCFLSYVACMTLFGIHNVIYSSHWISFFTIGALALIRRPADDIRNAAEKYLKLSYLQLISQSGQTPEECLQDAAQVDKLRRSLHSRMVTGRTYYILALFILLCLDFFCILQLRSLVNAATLSFLMAALLATLAFIMAFLAANVIIRNTKN